MEQNLVVSITRLPPDFFEKLQGTLGLQGERTREGLLQELLNMINKGTI